MSNICLLGGTFNPPHIGHKNAALAAAQALKIDRIILMPALIPPHKTLPEDTPAPEQRLEMTRMLAREIPGGEVSDRELTQSGAQPSYTADTLKYLREIYPDDKLLLLVGDDMFITMHQWSRPEEIFALCSVAVVAREIGQEIEMDWYKENLEMKFGASVDIVRADPVVISSTRLRRLICQGMGKEYLPAGVWEYIAEQKLYGFRPSDRKYR